ncbi:conserved hypothetical protein [Planktothrix serta PCC 8927]|uniref:PEP-CTERM protein-sorting domain-containing protein n=2 Tax=Planktothrix TaxID=54304 RepID=A0A7Z9BUY4_9CYAN|nr:conserved hypothetical protein [Planktothrix serta PCC 8927]
MKISLRQLLFVGFVSTFTVTLTERSTVAFTLVPAQPGATSNWRPVSPYLIQDNLGNFYEGSTEVDTRLWMQPISPGGTGTFKITLGLWATASERGFFGWNFQPAEQELKGSFDIVNYLACGYSVLCGIENPGEPDPRDNGVGATFYLKYRPAPDDPQPGQQGRQLHWIQMVRANYGVGFPGGPILPGLPFIDNLAKRDDPYYDTAAFPGEAGEDFFMDRPYSPGEIAALSENYFEAELYLVEETTPVGNPVREVTIYNGIKWGWINKISPICPNNTIKFNGVCLPPQPTQTFSGTLTAGFNENQHQINGLTPGNYFYAWTKNDLPSNQCNPNTYLTTYNNNSSWDDDDSSLVGDGFASALAGIVADDGTINLSVRAANPGGRGEDSGDYELYTTVYDSNSAPPEIIVGSSGGGGVVFPRPRPGGTQQNPILPTSSSSGGWQIFNNVPGCRWYDPHTTYGFEFQALENTLFTEILDFPVGQDNRFTVSVADTILGEFSPGDRLNFVSLFGAGVSNFRITDIDPLIGNTKETAFPIQLAFNQQVGSFQMRAIEETPSPKEIPEPKAIVGLFMLGGWGIFQWRKIQQDKEP